MLYTISVRICIQPTSGHINVILPNSDDDLIGSAPVVSVD